MDAIPSLELLPSLNVSMGPLVPVSVLSQIGATESPKRTQGVPIPPGVPLGLGSPCEMLSLWKSQKSQESGHSACGHPQVSGEPELDLGAESTCP